MFILGRLFIKNVNLIDGTGSDVVKNTNVYVEDGRFSAVGPDVTPAEDVEVVDGKGQYI